MKTLSCLLLASSLFITSFAQAGDSYVRGYTKQNGTVVQGYHRSTPDNTVNNNYGTAGNTNPYTGAYGTHPRDNSQGPGAYNAGNGMGVQPLQNPALQDMNGE